MSQFYSGADLKRGVLQRAGEPTDGTSEYEAVVMKYINQVYFGIISGSNEFDVDCGEPWFWARASAPLVLTLQPPYGEDSANGTVTVTSGSTAGVFSVAPVDSLKGQYLWVDDDNPEKYRITAHIAGAASFTLDGPYNGATKSGANFRVLRLVYPIGTENEVCRLVEPFRVYQRTFDEDLNYQIFGLDPNSFHANYPLSSIVAGVPNRFMTLKNEAGQICVQFNQWVSQATRCEVDYLPMPIELIDSDQSIPLIPRPFRSVLEYGPTALIMFDKDDSRASGYVQLTTAKMKALTEAYKKELSHINSKSKGKLFSRPEQLKVRQRIQSFVRQN